MKKAIEAMWAKIEADKSEAESLKESIDDYNDKILEA